VGQVIAVDETTVAGEVAAFHTDRAITGQDGVSFDARPEDAGFAGDLAARIFDAGLDIDHVFVASNQVVVRRSAGWGDDALGTAQGIIEQFFVFYAD